MTSFPERLALARRKKGFSQEELADLMGYKSGKQVVYKWEKGVAEPSLTQVRELAAKLDVTVIWLIDGVDAVGTTPYIPPPDKVLLDASEAVELYRNSAELMKLKQSQSAK